VWGINDFDEAHVLPYTNDLVRLGVSAILAIRTNHLRVSSERVCEAILDGYSANLKSDGRPFVLEEEHQWLRTAATGELRSPHHFWSKMDKLPTARDVPKTGRKALENSLPEHSDYKLVHRIAGVGSLGHERYVALTEWQGARIAREVKALAPSACVWADGEDSEKILYEEILDTACRAADPYVRLRGRWLIRRLGPYCSRIELAQLPRKIDETKLLEAMGYETANIHIGSKTALKSVRKDFSRRGRGWLRRAVKDMTDNLLEDYRAWCKSSKL